MPMCGGERADNSALVRQPNRQRQVGSLKAPGVDGRMAILGLALVDRSSMLADVEAVQGELPSGIQHGWLID